MFRNILFYTYASGFFIFNGSSYTHLSQIIDSNIHHKIVLDESFCNKITYIKEDLLSSKTTLAFNKLSDNILFSIEDTKDYALDDAFVKYNNYISFIELLIQEINLKKLRVNQENLTIVQTTPNLYLNGKNNQVYGSIEDLFRKKLDYTNNKEPLKCYTMLYNLTANYFITPQDNNNQLLIEINPVPRYKIKTTLAEINIVLVFSQLKQTIEKQLFKLKKVTITVPHLLKGTYLQKLLKTQYPNYYEMRNFLKTCLTFHFDDN